MVEKIGTLTLERLKKLQWSNIFHMYYIEPVLFLLLFSHSLSGTISKNQVIYQACTTIFNYNETDCRLLGTKNTSDYVNAIETEVQPYVAHLFMVRTLLESIVPAICGIFIGSWSDHYGRKPLLLVSMIGFSFTYIITAIICELSLYYPVNPWYYILAVVPHSVLGGNCVFSVAAFCYISDVTDTKTRPYRMIFMEAFFFIGLMSGSLLSSYVYAATNATITFVISGVIMCLATVFIALYVPESLHYKRNQELKAQEKLNNSAVVCFTVSTVGQTIKDIADLNDSSKKEVIEEKTANQNDVELSNVTTVEKTEVTTTCDKNGRDKIETDSKKAGLFSYVHISDMLVTCFHKRPYYDRCIIWLVTGAMFLSIFVFDGGMTVLYLFVREKFHWSVRDFTFFESVSHMVPLFGALVGFLFLRNLFSMSVVSLGILAFFSQMISCLVRGLAAEPWHLYLSVALGAFASIGGPMCRTIVSNIVPATDLGKIFSIKNVLQSIAPFIASPLYTFIYQRSLTTFPGLFNIVSAVLFLIALIFFVIVQYFKIKHKEYYAKLLK